MHGGVGVGRLERGEQLGAHAVVDRVALLGPVQRDAPHVAVPASSTAMNSISVTRRSRAVGHELDRLVLVGVDGQAGEPHSVHGRKRSRDPRRASRAARLRRRTRRGRRRRLRRAARRGTAPGSAPRPRRSRAATIASLWKFFVAARPCRRRTARRAASSPSIVPGTSSVMLHGRARRGSASVSSERPARAAPFSERGPELVRVGGREAHRDPAVGDLGRERNVLRAARGEVDRRGRDSGAGSTSAACPARSRRRPRRAATIARPSCATGASRRNTLRMIAT